MALRLVLIHAPEDAKPAAALARHLAVLDRAGHIKLWRTSDLLPSDNVKVGTQQAINEADAALILASPDLLAGAVRDGAVAAVLAAYVAGRLRAQVLLLRDCAVELDPGLSRLPRLPADGRPILGRRRLEVDGAYREGVAEVARLAGVELAEVERRVQRDPSAALLLAVLLCTVIFVFALRGLSLLRSQSTALSVVLLGLLALLVGVLGNGAIARTGWVRPGPFSWARGPLAFLLSLGGLLGTYLALGHGGEWIIRGSVIGLPPGRDAEVVLAGCRAPVDRAGQGFTLVVHEGCDQDPLHLTLLVPGQGQRVTEVARAEAHRPLRLRWDLPPQAEALSGVVLRRDGKTPVVGAEIWLERCPRGLRTTSDRYGRFMMERLPVECSQPPYALRIYLGNLTLPLIASRAGDIEVLVP